MKCYKCAMAGIDTETDYACLICKRGICAKHLMTRSIQVCEMCYRFHLVDY